MPISPAADDELDDELASSAHGQSINKSVDAPRAPPPPPRSEVPTSPKPPMPRRASTFGSEHITPSSPTVPGANKRASRLPPPIPGGAPIASSLARAPPPPPPTAPLSRSSTGDKFVAPNSAQAPKDNSDEEITEYEGDYDTDIASTVPHKDALKSHAKDADLDEPTPNRSSMVPQSSALPHLPPVSAPRAVPPPPPPTQSPTNARQSADMPRAAPPPPPTKVPAHLEEDIDEFDTYNYNRGTPPIPSGPKFETAEQDLYSSSPRAYAAPLQERAAPPPPPRETVPAPSKPARPSVDLQRSGTTTRRSVELGRMSMDSGYVANDVDLAQNSFWWTKPNGIPPVFQNRKDLLYEMEETSSTKRGGKTTITKDLYVLFQDYSQTVITAQFDTQDPTDVKLDQRHEPPPSRLRQDQLEQAHDQFGRRIAEAASPKKETVVGDGTSQGLVQELLKPFPDALLPIGTRSYGAVVYANLANASTQQNDEIRPGDVITLRNAKFQGKHGPMHAKYSMEVGKPDHVGVVAEWDGTKKKVKAWEQGRESKKVKLESFKLDDLRSGEVKIWRVMARSWVGWQGQN
jgi:hypothetical protein